MAGERSDETRPATAASWLWPIAVLALCHAQAIASFQILNILIDPIKASLEVTDTQYSLLQGFAVAIFAAMLGLPAARWADRRSRRNVILAGAVGWSVATVGCAFAATFGQLFAGRVLMGIGEVFLFPAALSLIADLVPRSKLSTAVALFGCGGPMGSAAALFGGSWVVAHHAELAQALPPLAALAGWRSAFLLCGLSGLITAGLLLTTAEPERTQEGVAANHAFRGVLSQIAGRWRAYATVSGGMLLLALCAFATAAWAPTVLTRVQGMSLQEAGRLTAVAALVGGALFAYFAGLLVDALHRRASPDGVLVVSLALAMALAGLAVVGGLRSLGPAASAAWILIYALLSVPTVLAGTALQLMTPGHMRAQVMAIHLLLVNLVALSLGPLLVAVTTERIFGRPDAAGQSLALVAIAAAGGAALLFLVGRRAFVESAAAR